jgi:predicted transcriptional regulator
MRRTQIYLDEAQDARLERRARAAGVTKSSLIRAAIDSFLARGAQSSELQQALSETEGALPNLDVPSRGEWERRGRSSS